MKGEARAGRRGAAQIAAGGAASRGGRRAGGRPVMIVRISGEDQYRLDDAQCERLNELDARSSQSSRAAGEDGFPDAYGALLEFVRSNGEPLPDDDLRGLRRDPPAGRHQLRRRLAGSSPARA